MSNKGLIDYVALRRAVQQRLGDNPYKILAHETGISESTISRIMSDTGVPDAETVARLCKYVGQPVETFTASGKPPDTGTMDAIEWHLLRDPKLKREDAIRVADMMRAVYDTMVKKSSPPGQT